MAYSRPGVYITERLLPASITQGSTSVTAGAIAAPFAQGPEEVTYVTSWYEFTKYFGGYDALYPATFGVGQFFANGGRELYVKRVLHSNAVAASVELIAAEDADAQIKATAKSRGIAGNNLRVGITAGSDADHITLTVYQEVGGNSATTSDDVILERYENLLFDDPTSSDYAATVVNLISSYITITDAKADAGILPDTGVLPLASGSNGGAVTHTDYIDYAGVTGNSVWKSFETVDRPLLMFVPNISLIVGAHETAVYNDAISWAEVNGGFVIAETPAENTVANAVSFASSLTDSTYAAVYYPHVYASDPVGRSRNSLRLVGPSGAVAGVFLATDVARGVHKAPAGLNAAVSGVVAMEKAFSSSELDTLNTGGSGGKPVNPIRQVPGAGMVIMGARTLAQNPPASKFVNTRRSLIYLNKQLRSLTEFAIFENNDEFLWSRIRATLTVFLNEFRNQGGLRGDTQESAFYVKCDSENNTSLSIQNGEVHIQVGVALQYPAEFIVIDLNQMTLN